MGDQTINTSRNLVAMKPGLRLDGLITKLITILIRNLFIKPAARQAFSYARGVVFFAGRCYR